MDIKEIIIKGFGDGNEQEQADHLNDIGKSLLLSCRRSIVDTESQACRVADRLDTHGIRMVMMLASFIKLKEEQGG